VDESSWPEIQEAVAAAPYPVTLLPADPGRAAATREALGMSTRSWLGAVVAHTGGLLIDHGWLRVLGAGHGALPDVVTELDPENRIVTVGHDVLGGEFVWIQAEPDAPPTVHHYAPDTLAWEDLGLGYAEWLHAMLRGSMTDFYDGLRWPGWETEVSALGLDQGLSLWPPPWTVEGKDLASVSRRAIPIAELIAFYR
jgi:hypothetical protein